MSLAPVDVVHWNPRKPIWPKRPLRYFSPRFRANNFGDLIGPMVVEAERETLGLSEQARSQGARLLSVGSIMHLAKDGDVIWGTGVNGKTSDSAYRFTQLDVRAVRGPRTRQFLMERGIQVPEVYGDPALLLPTLFPELREQAERKKRSVLVVPNLNEWKAWAGKPDVLNPREDLWRCLREIASSEMVVGSSLHGIIVAEALGIPARLIKPAVESPFKYDDYFEGTGRTGIEFAYSRAEAERLGGAVPLNWQPDALTAAFPRDLWQGSPATESAKS